jgi:predicted SAM-dependent methyltransferase
MRGRQAIGGVLYRMTPGSWRTFSLMRYEASAVVQRTKNALDPRHHLRVAQLRRQTGLSINLGAGPFGKEGWVNADLRVAGTLHLDIRKPLPFADRSACRIFAEHVVEHLDFHHEVPSLLRECHRVLEPGGTLRVIVPDAGLFCRAYASGHFDAFTQLGWDLEHLPEDIPSAMGILNHVFHQGGEHLWGWDWLTMALTLRRAGFKHIQRQSFGVSVDPKLAIDQENHRPYSLYVEARK